MKKGCKIIIFIKGYICTMSCNFFDCNNYNFS